MAQLFNKAFSLFICLFCSDLALTSRETNTGMIVDANVSPERVTNNLSQETQPLTFDTFLQFNQNFLNPWRTKAKVSIHDMHPVFTQRPDLPAAEGLPEPVSTTIFDKVFSEPHNLAFDSNKEFKSVISLGPKDIMSSEEQKLMSQNSAVSNICSAVPTTAVALGEENKNKDEKLVGLSGKECVMEKAGKELTGSRVAVEKGKAVNKVMSDVGAERNVNGTLNLPTSSVVAEIKPKLGVVNILEGAAIHPYKNSTDVSEVKKKNMQAVALISEQYGNQLSNPPESENMTLVDLVDLTQKLLSNTTLQPVERKPDD